MNDLWYVDRDNLLAFATWLESESYFNSTADMLRFFEKPWKWTSEYGYWKDGYTLDEIEEAVED